MLDLSERITTLGFYRQKKKLNKYSLLCRTPGDEQGFVQGDRLEVLDRHLTRQGDDLAQLVYLTHGVVENGGDDSSVAVAWRTGITFAESEAADRHLAVLVEGKFKAHAVGIVQAASEAVILLHADVARVVAVIG